MVDDRAKSADSPEPMPRPDDTAAMPRADDTAAMPRADDTAAMPRSGAGPDRDTVPLERPDATRTLPAVPDEADARWSARASVPPPGTAPVRTYEYLEEEPPPVDSDRSWLTPVAVGFIGLLLLGALLVGLWLIVTSDQNPEPEATPPAQPTATTAAPTSAPPTTPTETSAPPSSTDPGTVVVPDLVGLSELDARQQLTDLGLLVEVTRRVTTEAPAGTVLEVSPAASSEVEPNTTVRLVVAQAPPTPSASSARSS
jgi:hypothetical protein